MAFRLASLAPNRYTLRLTTGGASGRGKAVVREIPFTVSP
jgi:hypothetical protein